MKKLLAFGCCFLLALAGFPAVSAAGKPAGDPVRDLAEISSNFEGEISVEPGGEQGGEDACWGIEFTARRKAGGGPAAAVLRVIKAAGKIADGYCAYLPVEACAEFSEGTASGALLLTRKDLADEKGVSFAGDFVLALFCKEGDSLSLAARRELYVPPLASCYEGEADFSGVLGSNYVNSSAVSQLHMWAEFERFRGEIDKDLYYAEVFGLNALRVFLHPDAYLSDPKGFLRHVEEFLGIASRHGFRVLFVFFDDCHQTDKEIASDFTPVFRSAYRWANSPFPADRRLENYGWFRSYVTDVVSAHREDDRVLGWDVWNEPWHGILETAWKAETNDLLVNAFSWVREARPVQPVMGVYTGKQFSDADERHTYGEIGTTSHLPEFDAQPITSNTVYTEAGNRVWGNSDNSGGSPNEYMAWLTARRQAGLPEPGVFLAWELMNSLTMTNFADTPAGLAEPPTVSSGMLFPDGTPCFLSEVASIRRYATGEELALFYDDFEDLSLDKWNAERGEWRAARHEWRATDPWKMHRIKDVSTVDAAGGKLLSASMAPAADYYAETTLKIKNFTAKNAGLLVRYDGAGNGYFVGFNLEKLGVYRMENYALTEISSVPLENANVWTNWHNLLRVAVRGDTIEVWLNPFSYEADIADPEKPSASSARKPRLTCKIAGGPKTGVAGLYAENCWAQFDDVVVMDYAAAQREVFARVYEGGESRGPFPWWALGAGAALLLAAAVAGIIVWKRRKAK